jgi:hypothetical protein
LPSSFLRRLLSSKTVDYFSRRLMKQRRLRRRRPGSLGFGVGCGGGRVFEMGMGALLQSCRRAPAPVVGARRAFS